MDRSQLYNLCKKAERTFYAQCLQGEPHVLFLHEVQYDKQSEGTTKQYIEIMPHLVCEVLYAGNDELPALLKLTCKNIHTYLGKTKTV